MKRGPNVWSKPHFHDSDRFVTVLEGTLWVGTGKFDPQRTVPLKAGSFVRDVAGGIHFEGTKDDGATLYFIGIGPSPSHPAEAEPTTTGSGADVIDPAVRQVQRVEDMPKESFVLYGDSSKPGLYVQCETRPEQLEPPTITRSTVSSWCWVAPCDRHGTERRQGQNGRGAERRIHPRYRAGYSLRWIRERSHVDSDCRRRADGDDQCRPTEVASAQCRCHG